MGAGSIGASASGMTGALAPERRVDTASDLELTLPARPENVAVARHAIGGFADVVDVPAQTLADAKPAVTQACPNVVGPAPSHREGPMGPAPPLPGARPRLGGSGEGRRIPPPA